MVDSYFTSSLSPTTIIAVLLASFAALLNFFHLFKSVRALRNYLKATPSLRAAEPNLDIRVHAAAVLKNLRSSSKLQLQHDVQVGETGAPTAIVTSPTHRAVVPSLVHLTQAATASNRNLRGGPLHTIALSLRITWVLACFFASWGCPFLIIASVTSVPDLTSVTIYEGQFTSSDPISGFCQWSMRLCVLSYGFAKCCSFLFFFAKQRAVRPQSNWTLLEKLVFAGAAMVMPFASIAVLFASGSASKLSDSTCVIHVPVEFVATELVCDFSLSSAFLFLFLKPLYDHVGGLGFFTKRTQGSSMSKQQLQSPRHLSVMLNSPSPGAQPDKDQPSNENSRNNNQHMIQVQGSNSLSCPPTPRRLLTPEPTKGRRLSHPDLAHLPADTLVDVVPAAAHALAPQAPVSPPSPQPGPTAAGLSPGSRRMTGVFANARIFAGAASVRTSPLAQSSTLQQASGDAAVNRTPFFGPLPANNSATASMSVNTNHRRLHAAGESTVKSLPAARSRQRHDDLLALAKKNIRVYLLNVTMTMVALVAMLVAQATNNEVLLKLCTAFAAVDIATTCYSLTVLMQRVRPNKNPSTSTRLARNSNQVGDIPLLDGRRSAAGGVMGPQWEPSQSYNGPPPPTHRHQVSVSSAKRINGRTAGHDPALSPPALGEDLPERVADLPQLSNLSRAGSRLKHKRSASDLPRGFQARMKKPLSINPSQVRSNDAPSGDSPIFMSPTNAARAWPGRDGENGTVNMSSPSNLMRDPSSANISPTHANMTLVKTISDSGVASPSQPVETTPVMERSRRMKTVKPGDLEDDLPEKRVHEHALTKRATLSSNEASMADQAPPSQPDPNDETKRNSNRSDVSDGPEATAEQQAVEAQAAELAILPIVIRQSHRLPPAHVIDIQSDLGFSYFDPAAMAAELRKTGPSLDQWEF